MSAGRVGRAAGDAVLFLLAAAGAVCIALVVAALAFNITIMLFATGSMSPTIPAGSAALVREIPAGEVQLGDVVTVERDGRLPVTHRVVGVDASPSGDGERRALTLRGDANPVDDPSPYDVATVRIVLWSVPGVAGVITALQQPIVLGGLTLGLTALVLWAFWPRGPRAPRAPRPPRRHERRRDADAEPEASTARARIGALGAVAALAVAAAAALGGAPAQAAPLERVVQGEFLRLAIVGDPLALARLAPGQSATLLLGASTVARATGTIALRLDVAVPQPTPLLLRVLACDGAPVAGSCAPGRELVPERRLDASFTGLALGEVPGHPGGWLRFDVRMPEQDAVAGTRAEWRVQADGFGELLDTGGDGGPGAAIPRTGLAASGAAPELRLLLAAGLLALGAALSLVGAQARRRRRRPS
ncbi:S26 family signal peptidase [Agromyces soli]|uniref:Signal peptidase I n=2 Tax=Agromyces soli TaxID=659012 RepID=A0ABY4ANP2_9MICO|nr:S26 family signal peptidase [Agromyces soli]UOE24777.1 hypothetical protein MTP13_10410 [Agromyces soli]